MSDGTPLGALLIAEGLLTEAQLDAALAEQSRIHKPLGRLLVESGAISEAELVRTLARQVGLEFVDLADRVLDASVAGLVSETLARRYQAFSTAATDAQFKYPAVCKSSWGSSLLWQVTGDPVYREWTLRMGDWYVDTQEPDGRWHPLVERTEADVIEVTLEFVMHLDTLIGALAARTE